MYNLPTEQEVALHLNVIGANPKLLAENAAVSGWDLEALRKLARRCRQEKIYNDFFADLDIGKRRALVERRTGREIYPALIDETRWLEFLARLEPMSSLQIPTLEPTENGVAEMRNFVIDFNNYLASLKTYAETWRQKISAFHAAGDQLTGAAPIQNWLATASAAEVEKWRQLALGAGFTMPPDEMAQLRDRFQHLKLRADVIAALSTSPAREAWKKIFSVEKASLEDKLPLATNPRVMKEILTDRFSAEQLTEVAASYAEEKRLNDLEAELSVRLEKSTGSVLSGRQLFLLVISFVVCMVGIANAMLMAITERFREIATMKCLGATDGYVLWQFMLEASLQGLVGGSVGMLIGFLLALIKNSVYYGGYLYDFFPLGDTIFCGAVSLFIGIILSSLASLYPSWSASRMAPMEAMRVE
jgi:hypothetical protein